MPAPKKPAGAKPAPLPSLTMRNPSTLRADVDPEAWSRYPGVGRDRYNPTGATDPETIRAGWDTDAAHNAAAAAYNREHAAEQAEASAAA